MLEMASTGRITWSRWPTAKQPGVPPVSGSRKPAETVGMVCPTRTRLAQSRPSARMWASEIDKVGRLRVIPDLLDPIVGVGLV